MRLRAYAFVATVAVAVGLTLGTFDEPAAADGTIITTGATILSGSGTDGVTIDPCAAPAPPPTLPPVGTIPAQGTFSAALPALPDTGDGSDGAFTTTTDMLGLPGGTYEHTTYEIRDGATVSYAGAVTLLVQGDVLLEGRIESASSGSSVTVIAGGSITVPATNGAPVTGVRTSGGASAVRLEAGGRMEIGATLSPIAGNGSPVFQSEIRASSGGVTLRAHGTGLAGGIEVTDTQLGSNGGSGGLVVGAADFVAFTHCDLRSDAAATLVQSFGELLLLDGCDGTSFIGHTRLEGQLGVEVTGSTQVRAVGADLAAHAFDGSVLVTNGSRLEADDGTAVGVSSVGDGRVEISASDAVRFSGVGYVETFGSGGIQVVAHGGSVTFEAGGGASSSYLFAGKTGTIEVLAANDVFLGGFSHIDTSQGMVEIRAQDEFQQEGETYVSSGGGLLDARAGEAISATTFLVEDTQAPNPYFEGDAILLVAGAGGIDVEVDHVIAADGPIDVIAEGDVRISAINIVQSTGDLTVQSVDGSIDVTATTIRTTPGIDGSEILIESFGGSDAVIDATDATIQTDDGGAFIAGPVSLLVHAEGAVEIDSFVLPKSVKLRINAKKPDKSSLKVAGFFDTGIEDEALAGAASVWIGDTRFGLDLAPGRRDFAGGDDNVELSITPARSGSSRAKFKLLVKGAAAEIVDPDGPLDLRFQTQSSDGTGSVVLQKGKYKLGKNAGLLAAPVLFPFQLKATHKGAGKDGLVFQAGLATQGGPPATIGDVTVRYGDGFEVTVPGGEFTRKGDSFLAKKPPSAPLVTKLTVDFGREKVSLKAKGLDLGPLPAEAGPVTLFIAVGEDESAVSVRVAPVAKRGQAKY